MELLHCYEKTAKTIYQQRITDEFWNEKVTDYDYIQPVYISDDKTMIEISNRKKIGEKVIVIAGFRFLLPDQDYWFDDNNKLHFKESQVGQLIRIGIRHRGIEHGTAR